ncbi:MAG: hypothetical protein P8M16_05495 [Acidimicrobiales bacterium]|nr:hypothetical protein [Acidimicrobiales bacterium]
MMRIWSSRRRTWAIFAILVGLWIVFAPFSRPLPGGAVFSFESTPEINCQTPVIGMLGDDQPTALVYTTPLPAAGDPTTERRVDCTSRARFRVTLGVLVVTMSTVLALTRPRSYSASPAQRSTEVSPHDLG